MRMISAGGLILPALGQGGWHLGDDSRTAQGEMAALRRGIALGMTLIDTAEMYGEGRSESLIGRALSGIDRSSVQLVSKVYPHNAGGRKLIQSCDASLKRLNTDYLDLYLLHWRGSIPLQETVEGMEALVRAGKIRRWGVSNFDVRDMEELWRIPEGRNCAVDQVLFHLGSRGIEYDLIPWLAERGVAVMAYCPLAQAGALRGARERLLKNEALKGVAARYGVSALQVMLAFTLRHPGVIAIPKASTVPHVEQNAAALSLAIAPEDWARIDAAFPPPTAKMHLDME